MKLIAPQAIIFDWDNTLVDTWGIIHQAMHNMFMEFGKSPWSLDEVKDRVAHSMRDTFPKMFGDEWEAAAKSYQQHYRNIHLEHIKPMTGAEDTLKFLQDINMPTAIISNKKNDNLQKEVPHLGWKKYFAAMVGSGDAKRDKPYPDQLYVALKQLDFEDSTPVWYIGDSVIDLQFCANSGAMPILFGEITETTKNTDGTGTYKDYPYAKHTRNHADLLEMFRKQLDCCV